MSVLPIALKIMTSKAVEVLIDYYSNNHNESDNQESFKQRLVEFMNQHIDVPFLTEDHEEVALGLIVDIIHSNIIKEIGFRNGVQ